MTWEFARADRPVPDGQQNRPPTGIRPAAQAMLGSRFPAARSTPPRHRLAADNPTGPQAGRIVCDQPGLTKEDSSRVIAGLRHRAGPVRPRGVDIYGWSVHG